METRTLPIPTVFDVAAYILEQAGEMTHMKLQKLVYYAQAWHLVWEEEPLFLEPIQAWINGPVVPELFQALKSKFKVSVGDVSGNLNRLDFPRIESIKGVLDYYGPKDSQYLSDLTHLEDPWKKARRGIPDSERGTREISHASMAEYYSGLQSTNQA